MVVFLILGGKRRIVRKLLAIFIVILLWHLPINAAAPDSNIDVFYPENIICESVNQITKCARLPATSYITQVINPKIYAHIPAGTATDDTNWTHFRNGVPITGHAENVIINERMIGGTTIRYYTTADCVISAPFNARFSVITGTSTSSLNGAEACVRMSTSVDINTFPNTCDLHTAVAYDGDRCPDGFFTVPYESWCGEGMVNIADAPYCADDVSGEYCLTNSTKPCDAGISAIKTSTGLSFTLWAEKYTVPALAVKYNNTTCYGNLKPGVATGAININHDGTTYHLIN